MMYLYDFFKVVRNDERFAGTALPAYITLLDVLQNTDLKIRHFDDLGFILETLFVKEKQHQAAFREILLVRRSEIIALLATSNNTVEAKPSPEPGDSIQTGIHKPPTGDPPGPLRSDKEAPPELANDTGAVRHFQQQMAEGFGSTLIGFEQSGQKIGELAFSGMKNTNLPVTEKPFLFSTDFFPVKNRHLQQAWRGLYKAENDTPSDRINIKETIGHIAKKGYFADLTFEKKQINKLRLFIFIDHSLSMMAVEDFGRELAATARISGFHQNLAPYYFNILPECIADGADYAVTDSDQENQCSITRLFASINKKDIAVLVYSDSGLLRSEHREDLLADTSNFLRFINKRCGYLSWVNPAPKNRWKSTMVGELYNEVPIFDSSRNGLEQAIAALKGKLIIKLSNPYAAAKPA